jgi:hypothetical protein
MKALYLLATCALFAIAFVKAAFAAIPAAAAESSSFGR